MTLALAMVIGTVAVAAGTEKTISVTVTQTKSDGTAAEVFAYNGATYVPLRYLSELLGLQVEWDPQDPGVAKLTGEGIILPAQPTSGSYKAGTYTASAQGRNGLVAVSVTFSDTAITKIEIVGHTETAGISDGAFETIPAVIVEYQSLGVDAISGATLSSEAILNAVADCVKQAGGDVEALKAAPVGAVKGEEVLQSAETDVLVIGGGAGLSAALAAAQSGAKVILVEKQAALGGATILSSGSFNAVDPDGLAKTHRTESSPALEALLAHPDESEAHPEYHALDILSTGSYEGNVELILNLTRNALDAIHWSAEVGGVQWTEPRNARGHSTVNNSAVDIVEAMAASLTDRGGEYYVNSRATELITENGRAAGAVVTNANGESVTVKAGKGVVIATGGFSANTEMRASYNTTWESLGPELPVYGSKGSTGDGILMGQAVGASLVDMGYITLKAQAVTGTSIAHGPGSNVNAIFVNREGNRFVAEDEGEVTVIRETLAQTGSTYYMVCDATEAQKQGWSQEELAQAVADGRIYSGEVLERTVADFNSAVKAGGEDSLGRKTWGNTIEVGPFYAVAFSPAVHSTLGGLQINVNAEVLGTDGKAISGLYAAGETVGDIHGMERGGGNTIAEAITYGRIAGANAAAGK